jgi:predicted enzyme related to lactoylglutathione lyase
MSKMVHFDIPASDPEKSMKFYEEVFGWKFTPFQPDMYWLVEAGPKNEIGINGALMKRRYAGQPISCHLGVTNIDEVIKAIEQHGCPIVVPKSPIPQVGWYAFFKDPDGNILGIWENDPSVK